MKKIVLLYITFLLINTSFSQTENCLEFNGSSDYILVGNENNFGTEDFTIEAWVFFDYTFNSNGYKIINKGNTSVGTPSNAGYSLRGFCTSLGTDLDFTVGHSNSTICRITYNGLSPQTWYHIAGVRKGRSLMLYVNGILVQQETFGFISDVNTNIPLSIGAIHKGDLSPVNEFLDGKIDEVRFWNVARTESEIYNNKDCIINSPITGLTTVYNFDQSTLNDVTDASGNDINCTLINNPIWTPSTVALHCLNNVVEESIINYIYVKNTSSTINLTKEINQGKYIVYDLFGKIVTNFSNYNGSTITLNNLSKGMYIIEIKNKTNTTIGLEKFIQF